MAYCRYLFNKAVFQSWAQESGILIDDYHSLGAYDDALGYAGQRITAYVVRELFKRAGMGRMKLQHRAIQNVTARSEYFALHRNRMCKS